MLGVGGILARDPRCPLQLDNEKALHYAHESNCSKFYSCFANGTLAEFDCNDGLVFDTDLSVCNWQEAGNCNLNTARSVSSFVSFLDHLD